MGRKELVEKITMENVRLLLGMYVCVYVYVCVCMYVCMCVCVCVCVCVCTTYYWSDFISGTTILPIKLPKLASINLHPTHYCLC